MGHMICPTIFYMPHSKGLVLKNTSHLANLFLYIYIRVRVCPVLHIQGGAKVG